MASEPRKPSPQADAQLAALGSETQVERRVKRVLPWIVSIVIHLCIAFAAVFITWTVANRPQQEESVLVVADFNAMQYDPVAAMSEAREAPALDPVVDFAPPAPSIESLLDSLRGDEPVDALSLLANGSGGSAGALGDFAPRSDPHAASFAGTSATNARSIVYLIDATGSMIAHLQIVIEELSRSLANLSPQQRYAVIFFQGDAALELTPGRYVSATAQERQRTLEWARSIVPAGATNPRPAIERALNLKPDVIFLLSHGLTGHGEFEIDQRELLGWLDRRNPIDGTTGRRATQINCIQFLDADPLETMQLIAEQHGGSNGYKFLSRRELGVAEH